MSDPFTNLAEKTGRTMPEWIELVSTSGLTRHTEILTWLKSEHGLSHGFANGIALAFRDRDAFVEPDDLVEQQYAGPKAALRPIYERLVDAATALGGDVEIAPKKSSVSLRRSKQFALIEAPSAKRIQLGLQLKGAPTTDRLLAGNAMCSHKVVVTRVEEVDTELLGWLREAYERG
jgi:predicted transport protein